jgi:hypothetical protein
MGPADGRFFVTIHLALFSGSLFTASMVPLYTASSEVLYDRWIPLRWWPFCYSVSQSQVNLVDLGMSSYLVFTVSLVFTLLSNRSLEWWMLLQAGEYFVTVQSLVNLAELGMVLLSRVYSLTGFTLLPRLKFSMMDGSSPPPQVGDCFVTILGKLGISWHGPVI